MSTVSASINSRQIQQDSQKQLDDNEITALSVSIKKGNEEGMLYTVNDMNGNFFEMNDEFYKYVSQYRFLDLDTLYSAITQEARVIQKNDIFQSMINNYYNQRFMKCLFNFYNNSPSFFKVLFPVFDNSPRANKNTHQAFQKYYYLLCIIDFTMKNKDDEKLSSLPLEFRKNITDWCVTRWDPNIEFQLTGPTGNQTITFDFAKHYQSLISVQNTVTEINDYNKIVKLQNLDDRVYGILNAILTRNNVYDKTPDYAREYNYNLDSLFLKQKYKDKEGRLIFNISYTDFGDSTNDTTKSRLEDIDQLRTTDITLSKLNIKKLEQIFNMYSRIKVSSLVVDKNTYITNLSQLKTVYLVFSGVACSDRTIGNNRFVANGDLAIPGTFIINHQGNYEFVPKTEYTSYRSSRTRVKNCEIYLTTYGSNSIASNILNSYAIRLQLGRLSFYNIPLKIVGKPFILFENEPYNRFNQFNQFPDIIFNNIDNKQYLNYKTIQRIMNEINEPYWYLNNIVNNEYKTDFPTIRAVNGTVLLLPYSIINNELVSDNFMYSYDLDTNIINLQQITTFWPSDGSLLNTMLYRTFMKEHLFSSVNYVTDSLGYVRTPVYSEQEIRELLNVFPSNNANIFDYVFKQNNVPISNEKIFTIRTVEGDFEDIQNLQVIDDLLLYVDKNTLGIYNSLQLPINSFAHAVIMKNNLTNTEEYYKVLDYITIQLPLTQYFTRIFPDTSSKLYRNDEIELLYGNEITFNYLLSSTDANTFNKCILTINNHDYKNVVLPFDLNINYNYIIDASQPNAKSSQDIEDNDITITSTDLQKAFFDKRTITIEFEFIVRNYDKTLTLTQVKNYITLSKFVINHITKTNDADNTEQVFYGYNVPLTTGDVLPSYIIASRYDENYKEIQLFNRNVANLDECNTVFRWQVNTNIIDYTNSTFSKNENIVFDTTKSALFNPMTSSSFLTYNFNNEIMNNNITLINLFSDDNYGENDLEIYNYIPNGVSTDTTTLNLSNCYISTSKDNFSTKTYIEDGTLYFDNTKSEIGYDQSINHDNQNYIQDTAEVIHVYDSNKYYDYDIYTIAKNINYNVDNSYYEEGTTDVIYSFINAISSQIATDIYKIIDTNIINRLKIILADNHNTPMNPIIGYALLHYIYRYVNNLYTLLENETVRAYLLNIGDNRVYERFYLLDFPLLLSLNDDEKGFMTKALTELGVPNDQNTLNMLKMIAKNFEVGIEIFMNEAVTTITIHYIYTKGVNVDKVINKLTYTEDNIVRYLSNIYYMKSPQYDSYFLLYEFAQNVNDIDDTLYTNREYKLQIVYKDLYFNVFKHHDIYGLIESNNQYIDILLNNKDTETIVLTMPYNIILSILSRTRAYYAQELEDNKGSYMLIENHIMTVKPSNIYYNINYYNNIYYKLKTVFGKGNYYKRIEYYYQLLFNSQDKNTPLFKTTETLSKHDYIELFYEDNSHNNLDVKSNSNAMIDISTNNIYSMYNYNTHNDIRINNINNDSVNIVLNKSDIELSLTWN